jgi:hypothetical protein
MLVESLRYIERVRSYGVNREGGRNRLPKTLNADLYYAGKFIINHINQNGTEAEKREIQNIIESFKEDFEQ